MKKREEDLLDDDVAAFEEFDAPREPAAHQTPTAAKPKAAKKEPEPLEEKPQVEEKLAPQDIDPLEFAPDVPVQMVAVLAKKTISFKDLFDLRLGSVVELGRPPSEYVDLVANGKFIGRGELVEIDGKLGVRIINLRTR